MRYRSRGRRFRRRGRVRANTLLARARARSGITFQERDLKPRKRLRASPLGQTTTPFRPPSDNTARRWLLPVSSGARHLLTNHVNRSMLSDSIKRISCRYSDANTREWRQRLPVGEEKEREREGGATAFLTHPSIAINVERLLDRTSPFKLPRSVWEL